MPATSTPADSTPTESAATPQSIEGEPAMTTTTTVATVNTGRESAPDEPFATENVQSADARLAVALLAHVAGAIESGLHRQSWRNPGAGDARWLRFLVSCGYTLADIERQIIDAATQPTVDLSSDAI
jgi:hypothetical protein